MNLQIIIFLSSGIIILTLLTINVFLFLQNRSTNKKINELLEKGKIKDFKDIFLKQKEKNDNQEEQIKEIASRVKNLEDISQTTIRKIGIVRYNPFNDMGGNQSFVIAFLDNKNNGVLISSLFERERTRIYAKTIKQGKPDYNISEEEQEALTRAMNSSNLK
jgi:hypothetical protein